MADELVPMRQAMGEAYLGDTVMAKQLFASPATFDQRVISLLSGLGQAAETPTAQAISGDNIKAVMAALDLTDNAKRVALVQQLIARFVPSHTIYPHAGCSVIFRDSLSRSLELFPDDSLHQELRATLVAPDLLRISGALFLSGTATGSLTPLTVTVGIPFPVSDPLVTPFWEACYASSYFASADLLVGNTPTAPALFPHVLAPFIRTATAEAFWIQAQLSNVTAFSAGSVSTRVSFSATIPLIA